MKLKKDNKKQKPMTAEAKRKQKSAIINYYVKKRENENKK